jgi:hypothetical protein
MPLWAGIHCRTTDPPSCSCRAAMCFRMYLTTYCPCGFAPSAICRMALLLSVAMIVVFGSGLRLAWCASAASMAISSATVESPAAHPGNPLWTIIFPLPPCTTATPPSPPFQAASVYSVRLSSLRPLSCHSCVTVSSSSSSPWVRHPWTPSLPIILRRNNVSLFESPIQTNAKKNP